MLADQATGFEVDHLDAGVHARGRQGTELEARPEP